MLKTLNSLWVGNRLGYVEQLSLISAMSVGHSVVLYSYEPKFLSGVPKGVELRDAREVMPEEKLVRYSDTGSYACGANFFRYELQAKSLGYWVDLDIYFLKSLDFDSQYLFGWQEEGIINSAVLGLPADSNIVHDLLKIPRTNRRPPFYGPKRTVNYYWKRLIKGDIRVQDLPWGTYGPELLTYLVHKHDLEKRAQKREIFYALRYQDARLTYQPASLVEQLITAETVAVHLWNASLGDLVRNKPPTGSFMSEVCIKHNVSMDLLG